MYSYERKYVKSGLAHELEFNFKNLDNEGKDYNKEMFKDSEEFVETLKEVNKDLISELEAIFIVEDVVTIHEHNIFKNYGFSSILIATKEEYEKIISDESLKGVLSAEVIDLRSN